MCMRTHKCCMRVYARKRREGERDIGAADLNIEHARNITRRNLIAKIERQKQRERKSMLKAPAVHKNVRCHNRGNPAADRLSSSCAPRRRFSSDVIARNGGRVVALEFMRIKYSTASV